MRRYAAKRDSNEKQIIEALEGVGASVTQISAKGVPDLLVGYQGATYLMETKNKYGKLTPDQVAFMDTWRGSPVLIVKTVKQALEALGVTVYE